MQRKNVTPLSNRVLVKREEPKRTKGGIYLPDTAKEKPKQGQVVAVGPGKIDEEGHLQPVHVKVGDMVLFTAYAGTEVHMHEEAEYLIMSEDEILGVLA